MISEATLERLVAALEKIASGMGPAPAPASPLMTVEEVAQFFRRGRRFVERLVAAGKLSKAPGLGGRTALFRREDVEKMVLPASARAVGRRRL